MSALAAVYFATFLAFAGVAVVALILSVVDRPCSRQRRTEASVRVVLDGLGDRVSPGVRGLAEEIAAHRRGE